jgi:serine protease Do
MAVCASVVQNIPRVIKLRGLLVLAAAFFLMTAPPTNAAPSNEPAAKSAGNPLQTVVGVRASLPPRDPTTSTLGREREGSGVVIDDSGLVLTIGYLMRHAEKAEIIDIDGSTVPAIVVGYDDDTGFGLLRAKTPLKAKPARLGKSAAMSEGRKVLIVSFAKPHGVTAARIFARHPFAAPWEYLLDNAIFTAPPHENFGGAALLGEDGRLLGIGSLLVNVAEPIAMVPGNMFVPIDILKPILADLIAKGERQGPTRPWLGIRTKDSLGTVVVTRVVKNGPGAGANLNEGDIIVGVNGKRITSMIEFFRAAWSLGGPGTRVPLNVLRGAGDSMKIESIDVETINRKERYRERSQKGL